VRYYLISGIGCMLFSVSFGLALFLFLFLSIHLSVCLSKDPKIFGEGISYSFRLSFCFISGVHLSHGVKDRGGQRYRRILQIYGCWYFVIKATYHCVFCHSECVGKFCLKLDYLGIVLSITSTGISAVYFALRSILDQSLLAWSYIGMIAFFGLCAFWVVLDPGIQGAKAAFWRHVLFIFYN